ncbi:hypothetical protein EJ05DRAFT_150897 [Pseudovirgaria hyperparasitica]|uniref:Uncharacterized protein n=1 Tax=Pseudovirgaria hyperparasitica TaxID=470096 RepID=A0A6A6VUA9_9PEZI|nr:uncharacterized protein EJ05DRAFT_150897 [Pseudovirgaria hyperparasitica]KAF2754162.1 hypothetical protein EJ05DRAFT_150897 [Pseudovirgaria hyperparasitica]
MSCTLLDCNCPIWSNGILSCQSPSPPIPLSPLLSHLRSLMKNPPCLNLSRHAPAPTILLSYTSKTYNNLRNQISFVCEIHFPWPTAWMRERERERESLQIVRQCAGWLRCGPRKATRRISQSQQQQASSTDDVRLALSSCPGAFCCRCHLLPLPITPSAA